MGRSELPHRQVRGLGVLAIVFAESGLLIGFFLSGDSLLFTTGLLITSGVLDIPLWLMCALIAPAAIAGDQAGYLFGHWVDPALFNRLDSQLFKQENVAKGHEFFERHGPKSLVLARFVPIVCTFTPIIARVSRMITDRSHLRHHRRRAVGRRGDSSRGGAGPDRVRASEHRGDPRRYRVAVSDPYRHRVHARVPQEYGLGTEDGYRTGDETALPGADGSGAGPRPRHPPPAHPPRPDEPRTTR